MAGRYKVGDGTIARARDLRKNPTPAEGALWNAVRKSQLNGLKFRRQQRIGPYFVDFACLAMRLIVEVDGETHAMTRAYDAKRTLFLENEGYHVLRFDNRDVLSNLEGVLANICRALVPSPSHSAKPSGPLPLPQGERG
ncbi:very-short-patch-repair endonuclease [Sphingobium fontiphilum]|uniref:Very-short-patch-repair endonuclease n=1 Tax=Sphingobium fontiphilum TaxID=944425 RepID=A0A7W6DJA2_9SPHN|nr:DUF559 domain-containing protein [Sphingobium fontiphilum]MBB3983634.1 very-short-patch-repair endonuclease [Sphingobium fontiphilum]